MTYLPIAIFILWACTIALPLSVKAADGAFQQGIIDANNAAGKGGLFFGDLTRVIKNTVLWLMGIAAILALAAIVWGGIKYVLSLGDEKKAEEAKHVIIYAVIGLLVIGGSFLIITTVRQIVGG